MTKLERQPDIRRMRMQRRLQKNRKGYQAPGKHAFANHQQFTSFLKRQLPHFHPPTSRRQAALKTCTRVRQLSRAINISTLRFLPNFSLFFLRRSDRSAGCLSSTSHSATHCTPGSLVLGTRTGREDFLIPTDAITRAFSLCAELALGCRRPLIGVSMFFINALCFQQGLGEEVVLSFH